MLRVVQAALDELKHDHRIVLHRANTELETERSARLELLRDADDLHATVDRLEKVGVFSRPAVRSGARWVLTVPLCCLLHLLMPCSNSRRVTAVDRGWTPPEGTLKTRPQRCSRRWTRP